MLAKNILLIGLVIFGGCTSTPKSKTDSSFTLVVVPDTQNAVDFKRQKSHGFAIDSSEIFIAQMRHIASLGKANGGNLAFVASVGDVWQHMFSDMDLAHQQRGIGAMENTVINLAGLIEPEQTRDFEIPKAIEGYQLISDANIPFGVAPGNHDYDAIWSVAGFPANPEKSKTDEAGTVAHLGLVHIGGLANFRRAFGSDTKFFKNKDWYIDGYKGGGSSAQIFEAAGYRFLHFAFEMQAGDDVLAWAQGIIDRYPGLPTFISTHDYLNPKGERKPSAIMDLALGDPAGNNSAEQLWQKFIKTNDQILMVFSGHQLGQATRIDENDNGHKVYQLLSDYQERGQAGLDAGQPRLGNGNAMGIGDGWFRELHFHLGDDQARVEVKTYSSHYHTYSADLESYALWYKQREQPEFTDEAFYQADEFTLYLDDFVERFGKPRE